MLLALLDSDHVDHAPAHRWLDEHIGAGWASCAITENGFVRIISQRRYPSPVSPSHALALLTEAVSHGSHEFWQCDISLLDERVVDRSRLHGSRQVTDAYLLALAVAHGGSLATFDSSVPLASIHGASDESLTVL